MRRAQLEEHQELRNPSRAGLDAPESWHDRIVWFLFSPIAALFIYIVSPIGDWVEYSLAYRRLKRNTRSHLDVPEEKTLSALWSTHGLDISSAQHAPVDLSDCLCAWVDYLYGEGTSQRFEMAALVNNIVVKQSARSKQITWLNSDGEMVHVIICYRDPADQLMTQLSDELPYYA